MKKTTYILIGIIVFIFLCETALFFWMYSLREPYDYGEIYSGSDDEMELAEVIEPEVAPGAPYIDSLYIQESVQSQGLDTIVKSKVVMTTGDGEIELNIPTYMVTDLDLANNNYAVDTLVIISSGSKIILR